jgi:NAD(P)-dependent dehydrogenase (short-subunit alcohol dehydrogenase family)
MVRENKRVVLVTGASSGIGLACARYLGEHGFRVYGISRRPAPSTPAVTSLIADVTDGRSVEQAIATVVAREGRLDIVVNNAGMGIAGAIEDTSIEDASRQFEVNLFGAFRVCRAALPIMRGSRSGYIVNIGSIGGLIALPYQGMYSASKFALEGFSEALRMEVRPFGIRVVLIEPGDHKTDFTQSRQIIESTYGKSCEAALALYHRARISTRGCLAKATLAEQPRRVWRALLLRPLSGDFTGYGCRPNPSALEWWGRPRLRFR